MIWRGEIGEPCLVPSEGLSLHAVVYSPGGKEQGNVCLVSGLFEEKRSSHRALVDFARALAGVGWWVLHPDLAGSGNSPGDLGTLTIEDWVGNVRDAVAWLRHRSGLEKTVLVGIRAGALIAARAARHLIPPPSLLQLWQPLVDGAQYLSRMQTRRRIQDRLTGPPKEESSTGGERVDVDGFAVGPILYAGLQSLRLGEEQPPPEMPVQILQVSARDRLLPDFQALQNTWGSQVAIRVQIARPFWNPHTPGHYEEVIVPAVDWLSGEGDGNGNPAAVSQ